MHVGVKLGVGVAAAALAGGVLGGGTAAAAQSPPVPGAEKPSIADPRPSEEEGHGPGAIHVGPEGAAKAMARLEDRDHVRVRWCVGTVLPQNGLNVRTGPGTNYAIVGTAARGSQVTTDWDTIQRRNGYLWVRLRNSNNWIADYKIGDGNGKWYIAYSNC
ncbi:hypothetical protein E1200_27740 [Actinomadura sp. GC306]|uniref:SH3 domain-containing protein n=1 Tax=Actinomadura sp. GC306 TaxID=2530367 RepID=UPI001047C881|nr:SH3 domain-containing protein [Actinomadura sp. GC306]TDC61874.1 hypothetical protein E1200_27740 [Actinomadura sp. GC306]